MKLYESQRRPIPLDEDLNRKEDIYTGDATFIIVNLS